MCGIIGILGKNQVAPQLVEALKRLEYRGYDSAGIATIVVSNGYTAGQDFHGAVAVRTAFDLPDPLTAEACRQIHAAATH